MATANGMQNIEEPESEEDKLLPAAQGTTESYLKRSRTPWFAWPLLIGAVSCINVKTAGKSDAYGTCCSRRCLIYSTWGRRPSGPIAGWGVKSRAHCCHNKKRKQLY